MLTQNALPKFSKPNKRVRGWTTGEFYAGHTIHALRSKHARPQAWPYDPFPRLPRMFPFESNKRFAKWVRTNWLNVLSAPDRAAWIALAATITIKTYQGVTQTPTGFKLYHYFESAWKPYWYHAGDVFDPSTSTPDTAPYSPWSVPPTPSGIVVTAVQQRGFDYEFEGKPGYNYRAPEMGTMIALPSGRNSSPFTKRIVDIFSSATSPSPWVGHFHGNADWTNVLPIPPRPGVYTCRIRYLTNLGGYTPSDWAAFTVTIPPTW